jgi:hypothetical protein
MWVPRVTKTVSSGLRDVFWHANELASALGSEMIRLPDGILANLDGAGPMSHTALARTSRWTRATW